MADFLHQCLHSFSLGFDGTHTHPLVAMQALILLGHFVYLFDWALFVDVPLFFAVEAMSFILQLLALLRYHSCIDLNGIHIHGSSIDGVPHTFGWGLCPLPSLPGAAKSLGPSASRSLVQV